VKNVTHSTKDLSTTVDAQDQKEKNFTSTNGLSNTSERMVDHKVKINGKEYNYSREYSYQYNKDKGRKVTKEIIACLRCSKPFSSVNKRRNRMCNTCIEKIKLIY